MKAYSLIILICSLSINGCSFTSQQRSTSPHFDGILSINSVAVENAKIMLSTSANDKLCLKAKKIATTNKLGQFTLKAVSEAYTYTPFVNYELNEWNICAKYNDRIYPLYSNNRYGSGHVKGSVYLQCNLATQPANKACTVSK